MISTKYVKDYRMDLENGKDGKQKRKMIYVGPLFQWKMDDISRKKMARKYLFIALAGLLLYFASIWEYSRLSHVWYVLIPYACTFLCLFFVISSLYKILNSETSFSRKQKDRMGDRLVSSCVIGCVLSAASGLGQLLYAITTKYLPTKSDILMIITVWALFTLFLFDFRMGKKLEFSEKKNPVAKEWENK